MLVRSICLGVQHLQLNYGHNNIITGALIIMLITQTLTLRDIINLSTPFLKAYSQVSHLFVSDLKMKAN